MNSELKNIKAFIFDMDGVLLDSETICDKTWAIAGKEWGLKNPGEVINKCRGMNKSDTKIILKENYGQDFDSDGYLKRTSELFMEIEKSEGLNTMPFAKECLIALKDKFRLALASSTRAEPAKRQLGNVGLIQFFETITTGDMVIHSKPDPEIYQISCNSLNLNPENCIAVEDSPNGARSALAAGLKVILIPDKALPTEELKSKCWKVFSSLNDLIKMVND